MPICPASTSVAVILLAALSWQDPTVPDTDPADAEVVESPRAVVAHWLELHRTGQRDEAASLTTGTPFHRASSLLSSKRDTGVRVARSLGNGRAAAVITTSLDDAGGNDDERVLLFWLVRREGTWRINKSDSARRRVVDERLRGFLEAGDVRWHVQPDELQGEWQAGPCWPPGLGGVACGSRLQLGEDGRYRLSAWGPAGPDPEHDHIMQGRWRLADGRLLLSDQGKTHECKIAWMTGSRLVVDSPDGRGRAQYRRAEAASR